MVKGNIKITVSAPSVSGAVSLVSPPLGRFYISLSDEKKEIRDTLMRDLKIEID